MNDSQFMFYGNNDFRDLLKQILREALQEFQNEGKTPYHSQADETKKLYTRNEIAAILKVTPNTVSRYRKDKLLHGTWMNGVWRFNEKELNKLLNQRAK
jgi:Fic family protein